MKGRAKKTIDGMDRDILRFLYFHGSPKPRTSNEIAKRVNLSAPAVFPRLRNLQEMGIVKPVEGTSRKFQRTFGNTTRKILSPTRIMWTLDMRREK